MTTEFRFAELRFKGRSLSGTAVTYGEVAEIPNVGRETFLPSSLSWDADSVILNRQHDRRIALARNSQAGGLRLTDSARALHVDARLPETRDASDTLELVKRKILQGFSIEFSVQEETRTAADVREIAKATLVGLAVVDRPAYAGSEVSARRRGGMSAQIPYKRKLSCKCHPGGSNSIEILDIEIPDDTDVLAIAGNYSRSIASLKKGSLELKQTKAGLSVEIIPAALETPAGKELVSMASTVPIYSRPVFDAEHPANKKFTEANGVATYEKLRIKAVLIGPTDDATGWPETDFNSQRELELPDVELMIPQPRPRLWL